MTTKEAIQHYGGIKQLASALGIWAHVIYRWGEHPPMARQYELEVKTNGILKAQKV
jgi:transcriptional repressor of cell division inhibition gene dicB